MSLARIDSFRPKWGIYSIIEGKEKQEKQKENQKRTIYFMVQLVEIEITFD